MKTISLEQEIFTPKNIVCVGRNYVDHILELNNTTPEQMVTFHKPNASISDVLTAFDGQTLHYEVEICFVVKNNHLYGVGVGLDLTKRSLQSYLKSKGLPWEQAKAFRNSAVLSRFVPLSHFGWQNLSVELFINSLRVQSGHVNQMIYTPDQILQQVLDYTDLSDGDILMTGTPSGVGEIHHGDIFTAKLKHHDQTLIECQWVAN